MLTLEQKIQIIQNSNSLGELPLDAMPYTQTDEYYFVSYSHLDYKEVYADILRLQNSGLNIWYDRGLPAGKNWEEMAEEAISKYACAGVIFYLSENALKSQAVKDEIEFVRRKRKDFLSINLPLTDLNGEKLYLPADKMLDEIAKTDASVNQNREVIDSAFSSKVIYLGYNEIPEVKTEKIKLLKRTPLIEYELVKSVLDNNTTHARVKMVKSIDVKRVTIPEFAQVENDTYYVSEIGPCAFANCKNLEEVTLDSEQVVIGNRAFFGCNELIKVNCPSLATVGEYAFSGCERLESLPPLKSSVQAFAFEGCKMLKSVTISEMFKYEEEAFTYSSIQNIIDEALFYTYQDGCLLSLSKGIANKDDLRVLCFAHPNEEGVLRIPSGVTSLLEGAIALKSKLKKLYIPYTLRKICDYAFAYCNNLEEVVFEQPNEHESNLNLRLEICAYAFFNCTNLKEINLPAHLEVIGEGAFESFSGGLQRVQFADGCNLHTIRNNAFSGCRELAEIKIPKFVQKIGAFCFRECKSLKKVIFEGETLLSIGDWAFYGTAITEINIPGGLQSFGESVFASCKILQTVRFGKNCSIKKIAKSTFSACPLIKEVVLPASLTKIGEMDSLYANAERIVFDFPSQLKKIEPLAFFPCFELKEIVFGGSIAEWKKVKQKCTGKEGLEASYKIICTDGELFKQ